MLARRHQGIAGSLRAWIRRHLLVCLSPLNLYHHADRTVVMNVAAKDAGQPREAGDLNVLPHESDHLGDAFVDGMFRPFHTRLRAPPPKADL